jgi:predicted SnoaL-like aldol condensation-catalyzing enzyme
MTPAENKAVLVHATHELFVKKDLSAIDRYWAEPYLQHNPLVKSGVEPFRRLMHEVVPRPEFTFERFRTIAEGDLVANHVRYGGLGAEPIVGFDLFRFAGGKIVEHWDALQREGPPSSARHGRLDGIADVTDHELTETNRRMVSELVSASPRYQKVHRIVAEGNFVLTQSEGDVDDRRSAIYDLFCVSGGTIIEHWDVVQEVPTLSRSGLGMF